MPDLITHYIFANEALEQLEKKEIIKKNHSNYNLGSSGPDYFFYYHILPYQTSVGRENVTKFGHLMHGNKINDFFKSSFEYIKKNYNESNYSYFVGYLMHYFLDRKAHPYIFYFSGVQDGSKEKQIYEYWHKRFEVAIDEKMLEERYNSDIKHFNPAKIVELNKINIEEIYDYTCDVIQKVYKQKISYKELKQSVYDFNHALKLLYSRGKWKKKLVLKIEKCFKMKPLISTAMYSIENEQYDYLNKQHKMWFDPCDDKIFYTKSFIELYEEALEEVVEFVILFDKYLENKITIDCLMKQINGLCFDTNHQEGQNLKYSTCIYENENVL